jgi:pyruvate decarboxylase
MQAVVTNLEDAHEQIDTAITTALRESKPVYLSISCNLPGLPHPTFSRDPVPFYLAPRLPHLSLDLGTIISPKILYNVHRYVLI